ncbi:hypothetical protein REC_127 [Pseudomonas phage REC]|nr:hypothetical protein REC_127 [Pseudomonas phage REC]UGL62702.1 hypothetical protein [Pseudomonas phage REC1]
MKFVVIAQCTTADIGHMMVHWFKVGQVLELVGEDTYIGESIIGGGKMTQIVPKHHLMQI